MTPAFANFVAPARARPQLWRLLLGSLLALAVYLGWIILLTRGPRLLAGVEGERLIWQMASGSTPAGMLLLLLSFVGMTLGTLVAARLLHRRGLRSLTGRPAKVLRDFVTAVAVVAVIYGLGALLWSQRFDAQPNLPPGLWFALLPLALAGVAVQTLSEELAFRGYLMQQLAVRFRSPLVWMGLPTLTFALLHYDPAGAGANAWYVVGGIGVFGLAAADLTRRSGSLGAAWGFHFANNCVAMLVLVTGAPLSGLALWRTPYGADDPAMFPAILFDLAAILLTWAILARLTAGRGAG